MRKAYRRWLLRRVIVALHEATKRGMRPGVVNFAKALEATELMARGQKRDSLLTVTISYQELLEFISYMTDLHRSKLSLIQRAKIGLVTLLISDKKLYGEDPIDFAKREFKASKSSKTDKRIQLIK